MTALMTVEEVQEQNQTDFENDCRDDEGNGSCPDCGTMFESHTEMTAEHKIINCFKCPKCGTESEEI